MQAFQFTIYAVRLATEPIYDSLPSFIEQKRIFHSLGEDLGQSFGFGPGERDRDDSYGLKIFPKLLR
jgi:hypothetical protein